MFIVQRGRGKKRIDNLKVSFRKEMWICSSKEKTQLPFYPICTNIFLWGKCLVFMRKQGIIYIWIKNCFSVLLITPCKIGLRISVWHHPFFHKEEAKDEMESEFAFSFKIQVSSVISLDTCLPGVQVSCGKCCVVRKNRLIGELLWGGEEMCKFTSQDQRNLFNSSTPLT